MNGGRRGERTPRFTHESDAVKIGGACLCVARGAWLLTANHHSGRHVTHVGPLVVLRALDTARLTALRMLRATPPPSRQPEGC